MALTLAGLALFSGCFLAAVAIGVALARQHAGKARWIRVFHPAERVGGRLIREWPHRWRVAHANWLPPRVADCVIPVLGAVVGLGAGHLLSGPVAGVALGAYGAAAVVMRRRRAQRRAWVRAHRAATDAVAALSADLSAGVAAGPALVAARDALHRAARPWPCSSGPMSIAQRVSSAAAVAEASGAPLADVLDRLDTHLRVLDRSRALAETQAAGARVSAVLLGGMPAAGIALGTAIGVDSIRVLLHTKLGGAALCVAVALQIGGFAWTTRLARVEVVV